VNDQTGSPTYTADLSRTLADLITLDPPAGVYNAVGPDVMTWHDLAEATLSAYEKVRRTGRPIQVGEVTSDQWPSAAKRPPYSVLSTAKISSLGIEPMRHMDEALTEFCQRLAVVDGPSG
jgi:dTDP-4-dehydrorhamnose reductase